jgi:cold shock CspA family protein
VAEKGRLKWFNGAKGYQFIQGRSDEDSSQTDVSLHERVRRGLVQGLRGSVADYALKSSDADLLVHQGPLVAVFEVKTGDPDLPLPSSTSARMLLLKDQVREQFPKENVEKVVPVLVTNYNVSASDQKELEDQGIKVVHIDASLGGSYGFEEFSRNVANLTGLQTDLV